MSLLYIISVVSCSSPDAPDNGYYTPEGATQYEDTVIFQCNTGYTLSGSQTATCQADGTWSATTPACSGMCHTCFLPILISFFLYYILKETS